MGTPGTAPSSGRIGHYRILRRLGAGGMGVVYLCYDEAAGIAAAVKVIRPEHATNPQFRARLRHEVAAARRVPRFCTAPVLAGDLDADPPWVATEYIDAPTLDAALLEQGRLGGAALDAFAAGVAVGSEPVVALTEPFEYECSDDSLTIYEPTGASEYTRTSTASDQ